MSKNVDLLKGLFGDQVTELSEGHVDEISSKLDRLVETRVESKVKFKTEVIEAEAKEKYDALLTEATTTFSSKIEEVESKTYTLAESYKSKMQSQVKEMSKKLTEAKDKEVSEYKKELVEKLDKYLNLELGKRIPDTYVESVAQVSILSPLVEGIKRTFEENHFNIDSENYGILKDAKEEIITVREENAKVMTENMDLNSELKSLHRSLKISKVCEGLTDTQSERAKTLLESYDVDEIEERYGAIKDIIIEGFEAKEDEKEDEKIGKASKAEADGVQKVEEGECEDDTKEEVTEEESEEIDEVPSKKLEEQRLIESYAQEYRKRSKSLL